MAFSTNSISTNDLLLAQMGLGFGSGLMQGNAQQNMNKDNQLTQLAGLMAQMKQRAAESRTNATQLDPLLQQRSRADFSATGDVVRNARPATLNFDNASGMGHLSGGYAIPEGGFSDQTKAFYDPSAMAGAEGQFYGNANLPYDLTKVGYQNGSANSAQTQLAQTLAANNANDPTKLLNERYNTLSGKNPDGSPKGDGTHHNWAKFLKIASIPAAFIPGVGPFASAGMNAAATKLDGGSWKQAVLNGGISYAGGKLLAGHLANNVPSQMQSSINGIDQRLANAGASSARSAVSGIDARLAAGVRR